RVIIPALQVVQSRLSVVPVATVPEWVVCRHIVRRLGDRCSGCVGHAHRSAVGIVAVPRHQRPVVSTAAAVVAPVEPDYVSLHVLLKVEVRPQTLSRVLQTQARRAVALAVGPKRMLGPYNFLA